MLTHYVRAQFGRAINFPIPEFSIVYDAISDVSLRSKEDIWERVQAELAREALAKLPSRSGLTRRCFISAMEWLCRDGCVKAISEFNIKKAVFDR